MSFVISALLSAGPVGAQEAATGPTPYPATPGEWPGKGVIRTFGWMKDNRAYFWASREKDKGAVVFAGDSLTANWKHLAQDFAGLKVANRGIGGDTSRGLLFRFQEDVLALQPKAVVILIGQNDLTAHGRPEDAASNIAGMVAMAHRQDPGMPVVLCTVPLSDNPKAPVKNADRLVLNARIAALARENPHVGVCDVYSAVANADGTLKTELFAPDRLHFAVAGHERVAELVKPVLETLIPGLKLQRQAPRPAVTAPAAVPVAPVAPVAASASEVVLNDEGIAVTVKGMGGFNLGYPLLQPGNLKPVQKKIAGRQADLSYAGDIGLRVEVTAGGKVNLRFSNAQALKKFTLSTLIGSQYGDDGGTWTIGKGQPKPFPREKPVKPHLYQGNAGSFTLTDAAGHVFSVGGFPDYAYQEITDNREWGWKVFAWKVTVPYNPAWEVHSLTIGGTQQGGTAVSAPRTKILVDRFGQTTLKDFPGKVRDESELKADVAGEAAYWASYKPLAVDQWGGLPGSREKLGLKATGFFRVEKKGDRWLLVNPDGNATFHLGICAFGYNPGDETTYIKDRHDIYEWIPAADGEFAGAFHPEPWWRQNAFSFYAANIIRKYGKETTKDEQIGRLIDRVRAVGFNSIGAFSGFTQAFADKHIPRMAHVGFGGELPGIRGVADPFDEAARSKTEASWAKSLPKDADNPLIIGYFFANEQGFEDIPRAVPQLSGKFAAKRKLVEMLKQKYSTIDAFNAAWNLQVADFTALVDKGLPVTTKAAFADMQAYTEVFLDTYFRFLTETFRKYDRNHLMVSNRWQPGTANNEALCRIAGKYMDVISVNYYTWGVDRTFMKRIYDWTGGKPQMWSEFFYSSGPEANPASYNLDMATQRQRGEAYRQYVEQAASLGFVVGIEWFTVIDQAVTGRFFSFLNGERANSGLFNVCDRPYDACLREMAKAHAGLYDVWLEGKKPFILDDPRFTGGAGKKRKLAQAGHVAPGSMKIDGLADGWPGRPPERVGGDGLVVGKDATGFEATFKVAWDAGNLYVLVNVTDPTPLNNTNEGAHLWQGDGVELFVGSEKLDQPGALLFTDHQVLLGGQAVVKPGSTHVINAVLQPGIQMVNVPSVDGSGYTLEAAIPWSALDVKPDENTELLFNLAVDDAPPGGNRTRQIVWGGGEKSSVDRSYWGRLQLVP